jgi:hypothetical protein
MGTLRTALVLAFAALLAAGGEEAVRIKVAATRGLVIPQTKGGGFQREFRFTAVPAQANRWILQRLRLRGMVFDIDGNETPVHLDVVEYYRVDSKGRTLQFDSHYCPYRQQRGGDLEISSTLTYGRLVAKKRGDTILSKSFVLKWAKDADGTVVPMRTRKGQLIPAERGERVEFKHNPGSIPTHYAYSVQWDTRPGHGSRSRPSGSIEVGTWRIQPPKQTGTTVAVSRPKPIPRIKKRH